MTELRGSARHLAERKAILEQCPTLPAGINFDDLDAVECPEADAAFAELYRRLADYRQLIPVSNGRNESREVDRTIYRDGFRRCGRPAVAVERAYDGWGL